LRFARGRSNDADQSEKKNNAEEGEDRAKAALHFACAHRRRGDWDREDSGALIPAYKETDLP